jgi:hypothetical protein
MKGRALWLTIGVLAGGCGLAGSRPLVVDEPPDAGQRDGSPSVGRDASMPQPLDARPDTMDAATDRVDPPAPADAAVDRVDAAGPIDATLIPIPDPSCWSGQLPAQVQPMRALSTVADACNAGASATTWTYPTMDASNAADDRANVVGRWAACSAGTSFPAGPHAGVEFGANGRWRLLASDGAGGLTPMTGDGTTGYYYLLGTGQMEIMGEGPSPIDVRFARFAGADVLRFDQSQNGASMSPIYARTEPSPLNGNDNLPSVSDGKCSMVGTWDLPANPNPPGAPAATFSFDRAGNFVGGPLGSDLCAAHTMYGTYRVSPGWFQLTSNVGLGACAWWYTAGYPAVFTDDCNSVTLTQMWDNCTGGRGYFNQVTTMSRRP